MEQTVNPFQSGKQMDVRMFRLIDMMSLVDLKIILLQYFNLGITQKETQAIFLFIRCENNCTFIYY